MSFSVLTLNLWNISEPLEQRYSALSTGLNELHPDIVCLQEVYRDPRSGRCQSELLAEYCGLAHSVEKNGLAVLCRYPVVRSDSVALPEFAADMPRHVLLAEFIVEGRPLLVANTHLAYPPELTRERKAQAEMLLTAVDRFNSGRAKAKIICGDFNDVPDSPAVCTVAGGGEEFRDVYGTCLPNNPGITYSRKNPYVDPVSTIDQRIDYIFVNDDLAPKSCRVVFDGGNGLDFVSDHFGVFCNLAFRS